MTLHAASLAVGVVLGAATVWQDTRRRVIPNRWVAAGLAAALAAYAAAAFRAPAVLAPLALHAVLSAAAALGLWYLGVWPAGDAKLFAVFSCLAALLRPGASPRADLFLSLLVNVFVSAALFVAAEVLVEWAAWLASSDPRELALELRAARVRLTQRFLDGWRNHRRNYLLCAWNVFALFVASQALLRAAMPRAGGGLAQAALLVLVLLAWRGASRVLVRPGVAAATGAAFGAVLLGWAAGLLAWDLRACLSAALGWSAAFWFSLSAVRNVLLRYLEATRIETVEAADVREGMILTDASRRSFVVRAAAPKAYPDGLSDREASDLRKTLKSRRSPPKLTIHRARGFAVWLFFGFLWTAFSDRNVVQWLAASAAALSGHEAPRSSP